jgi:formylglycine-generating enzyme required for sulfatase activity
MGTVGRFEIRGVLGSGAFGKVYRAFDPQLSREVAVKVPLASTIQSEKERSQFLKEARSAANINHPNICQIHEVGEADGRPYIVMAIVRGQSLAETLKARKEPLPEKQCTLVVRKIALALAAAHNSGIVHRDLKPGNVMFDRERKDIIVMDFGLARGPRLEDARGTQSGVIMGTPAYMSPEQARGDAKGVGPAGDIFSLGVILYELLTGVRPFTGTATEVIGQILHVEPAKPSAVRPGIDPCLEAVCLKAMEKGPTARFASMKEFAAALDAVLRTPAPTGPAVETAKGDPTRREGNDEKTNTSNNLAEVFAALSDDRKQARAETAAVVEAAIAKHRTPRWMFLLVGLLFAGGLTVLASVVFFTRSDKVKVDLAVIINVVDLKDKSLSFFLGEEPIAVDALAEPVELKPGVHIFTVKRGKDIVKRVEIRVEGGKNPGIKTEDITPPPTDKSIVPPAADYVSRSTGMVFKRIPAGSFLMGTAHGEERVLDIERPQHRVRISKAFHLGKTEVTQRQYREVTDENPSIFRGDDLPVDNVSWYDAVRYCNALSLKDGKKPCYSISEGKQPTVTLLEDGAGYRLPTEAEWEYACRAGTTGPFSFDGPLTPEKVNYNGSPRDGVAKEMNRQKTVDARSLPANGFGLHEMHGNVWEWCWDAFDKDYYKSSDNAVDPQGPKTNGDAHRVFRGGGYSNLGSFCRSSMRLTMPPGTPSPDRGFRVVAVEPLNSPELKPSPPTMEQPVAEPVVEPLLELPQNGYCNAPWLSSDGLTIYFQFVPKGDKGRQLWQADRKHPGAKFENLRKLFPGEDVTVTTDGLEMIFVNKFTLWSAVRSSTKDDFGPPQEIQEMIGFGYGPGAKLGRLASPSFSDDGLFIWADRIQNGKVTETLRFRRKSRDAAWSDRAVVKAPANTRQFFVSPKKGWGFCTMTVPGDSGPEALVALSTDDEGQAFSNPKAISVRNEMIRGRSPRYVPQTRELFFAQHLQQDATNRLYVIRHFDPK